MQNAMDAYVLFYHYRENQLVFSSSVGRVPDFFLNWLLQNALFLNTSWRPRRHRTAKLHVSKVWHSLLALVGVWHLNRIMFGNWAANHQKLCLKWSKIFGFDHFWSTTSDVWAWWNYIAHFTIIGQTAAYGNRVVPASFPVLHGWVIVKCLGHAQVETAIEPTFQFKWAKHWKRKRKKLMYTLLNSKEDP